jgi:hypothetical protein
MALDDFGDPVRLDASPAGLSAPRPPDLDRGQGRLGVRARAVASLRATRASRYLHPGAFTETNTHAPLAAR